MLSKLSLTGKIVFLSIILQAIIVSVLECLVVYFHVNYVSHYTLDKQGQGISEADLIYHAIFILSLGFQIVIAADALWHRNVVQLLSLVVFNLLSLIYASIQLYQHKILEDRGLSSDIFNPSNDFPTHEYTMNYYESRMRPLEYVIIGMVSGFSLFLGLLSINLTREFGWENYKTYSADMDIRKAYVSLSVLQTLIKLDIFFIGSYAIQLIPSQKIGYNMSIVEIVLIFFCGTMILLISWFSIVHEMKYLLLCVINMLCISLIYLIYELVRINIVKDPDPYEFTRRFLTFFLSTTWCLIFFTVVYSIICFRNMMKGIYVITDEEELEENPRKKRFSRILSPTHKPTSNRQSAIDQRRTRLSRRETLD
ncbi:6651_t:CDS:2 [Acaulospora morrowiae]|uniref:6651_t:CDS:1 n=1 Tax=Acaulospora morrowiae TaxID=94023 RepID=A0A9N8YRL9_9GLOM|nr:6651_t:CDS:2 [Acaulospora morrowiae]